MHRFEKRLARLEVVWSAEPLPPPQPPWQPDEAYWLAVLRILSDSGGMPLLCAVFCPHGCTGDVQQCDTFERALEEWYTDAQI